jgi:hypothetical protein
VLQNDARVYLGDSAGKTWPEARDHCHSLGMELASVTSWAQKSALWQFMSVFVAVRGAFWVGRTDSQAEGAWAWVDGAAWSYTDWEAGEPGRGRRRELRGGWRLAEPRVERLAMRRGAGLRLHAAR